MSIYKIQHTGYTDPKLYEPLKTLEKQLNLEQLSHKEIEGSLTKYRCWEYLFLIPKEAALLDVTIYPENEYIGGYFSDKVK